MIRQKDGIHLQLDEEIIADAHRTTGDVNIVSHAHADHMPQEDATVISSEATAHIASERSGKNVATLQDYPGIDLIPAGHIVGSRAALIERDRTYLYTGDVSTRDRCYMNGFDPPHADVLILETTYGIPPYEFPSQEQVDQRIREWVSSHADTSLFLFGYSLGKAQKIQHIVQDETDRPIYVHGAIKKMNDAVEAVTDLAFRAEPYTENKDDLENAIVVMPSRVSRADWINELVEEHTGLKAGFSGWAAQDSFKYQGGYDKTFVLSDHCDFTELEHLVASVDPSTVYTHHGFDEAFAKHVKKEFSIDARPLKHNQTTLNRF